MSSQDLGLVIHHITHKFILVNIIIIVIFVIFIIFIITVIFLIYFCIQAVSIIINPQKFY